MQKIKSLFLTIPVAAVLVLGLSTAAAYALTDATGTHDANEIQPNSEQETNDQTQNETEAKDLLQTLRKDHKEHTVLERKKNCLAAEHGLETKLSHLGKNAQAYLTRIDNIFTKAKAFQSDNNITVDNWDQLVATAEAAQTKAASSVAALQALNVNLDCTSGTVAENVATFKTAAKQARTDLKSYKMAVKDILIALKDAKGSTTDNSTGGTQ